MPNLKIPFKVFAEAMPQMAFIADCEGTIIYYNSQWYEYVGGIDGTEGWGWKDKQIHHPEDLERTIKRWNESLKTGKVYEIEYRLRRHDGEYRWHLGRANPVKDNDGKIKWWLGTNTDIHSQKQSEESLRKKEEILHAEQSKLQELLTNRKKIQKELSQINDDLILKNIQLEKVNQLHENLMYIMAHDLKNPIANMTLTLQLMEKVKDEGKKRDLLSNLGSILNQQEEVINGLMEIIQVQSPEEVVTKDINLEEVVKKIIRENAASLTGCGGDVEYDFSNAPALTHIKSFVFSILNNLVSNSIKYCKEKRRLLVKITGIRKENGIVLIKVEDNGAGMDLKKFGPKLFHPFKRFSHKGNGKGIGLYIIKNLIEKNDGYITVESEPNVGTTFYCYFKEYE